jgi:hypothetical protein
MVIGFAENLVHPEKSCKSCETDLGAKARYIVLQDLQDFSG